MERGSDLHNTTVESVARRWTAFDQRVLRSDYRRRVFAGVCGFLIGLMAWIMIVTIACVTLGYYAAVFLHKMIFGDIHREFDMRFTLILDITITASLLLPTALFFFTSGFHYSINLISAAITCYGMVLLADKGWLWYTPGEHPVNV